MGGKEGGKMEKTLRILFDARVPVVFWGPPGVGKTACLEHFARQVGAELIVPHVRSPEDFALPVKTRKGVEVLPVAEFRKAVELTEAGKTVIVFLDELTTLPPAVQAAVLRFLDSGMVGSMRIPQSVWRISAANPPEWAAGGWELSAPVANRLIHIEWKLDPEEWCSGFISYWGNPPNIPVDPEKWARARSFVVAYIRRFPHHLLVLPRSSNEIAWPSPRTWDFASRIIAAAGPENISDWLELVTGAVGPVGYEFGHWVQNLDLPDPEEVLASPETVKLPPRQDQLYALLISVVTVVIYKLTPERWLKAWKLLARVAREHGADVAAFAAHSLARERRGRLDLPLPVKELQEFYPVLQKAGLL
ncbi:MAG: ATP-binding protein [Candidatus Hadarchaeales archaeon]